MRKKILAIFFILCLLFVLTACSSQKTTIKSDEQAVASIQDVSKDVSGISSSLKDINNNLG
ncbi:hypothetical protein HZA98_01645 [Candidatus Woesearchaeota archaeon]|nr:hypothetical protein [Candidatus Woesearchaeota archaeon]